MITIIKEANSVVIFTVRTFESQSSYSLELIQRGNNIKSTIILTNPEVYSGRALKFYVDLSEYKEGSYDYRLLSDENEADFGDFYIKDISENKSNTYL